MIIVMIIIIATSLSRFDGPLRAILPSSPASAIRRRDRRCSYCRAIIIPSLPTTPFPLHDGRDFIAGTLCPYCSGMLCCIIIIIIIVVAILIGSVRRGRGAGQWWACFVGWEMDAGLAGRGIGIGGCFGSEAGGGSRGDVSRGERGRCSCCCWRRGA